jgi:hypothetical protein
MSISQVALHTPDFVGGAALLTCLGETTTQGLRHALTTVTHHQFNCFGVQLALNQFLKESSPGGDILTFAYLIVEELISSIRPDSYGCQNYPVFRLTTLPLMTRSIQLEFISAVLNLVSVTNYSPY